MPVASALVREVGEISRTAGITRIVLDAWGSNDVAHRYFEADGFAPLNVILAKTLG